MKNQKTSSLVPGHRAADCWSKKKDTGAVQAEAQAKAGKGKSKGANALDEAEEEEAEQPEGEFELGALTTRESPERGMGQV